MKKKLIIIILAIFVSFIGLFFILMTPKGNGTARKEFIIASGQSKVEIASNLKSAGIIKSKYASLLYMYIKRNIQAGKYMIDQNDSAFEIVNQLSLGDTRYNNTVRVTLIEGLRLKDMAKTLASKLDFNEEEFINKCQDREYVESLIERYSFLTDDILDDEIYYFLEGYLAPDTYEFYKNSTPEMVITKLLDNMENKLDSINDLLESSNYSIHDALTLASMIELEAAKENDRKIVSQVFQKRLNEGIVLGSDVTTYYGAQVDLGDYISDHLGDKNGYNTRNRSFYGLPVGPICSPSLTSIKAVFNPADTNYYYFAADVNTGEVFYAKTDSEWNELLRKLGLR